jgi:hypothetical protein
MADVYLSDGKAWSVEDYEDSKFDKTLKEQDLTDLTNSNHFAREQKSMDISFPYLGVTPRYAFTSVLSKGTVISRDHIITEYHDAGIFSGSRERKSLSQITPKHFKKAFGEKYRNMEDTNVLFTSPNSGVFGNGPQPPGSLYTSSADLTVMAYNDDLDESYGSMLNTRKEVEEDLQRLANKFL